MYRAFFALPASLADPEGRPVNAVHGYLDMLARLLLDHGPDAVTHVLDDAIRPAERVRAYPEYKANRPPDPEGLPEQWDLLEEVLAALGAERAVAPGWEADDAIAALCAAAGAAHEVEIVTGDRDLLALVRDSAPAVRVLFTVRGVSALERYDEAAVRARYGVPPERYAELAMLRGDPSDGLPGVPGVGAKTAARLVGEYTSLAALLDGADAQTPRLAKRLRDARAYLLAMRDVVPVRAGVEVVVRAGERDDRRLEYLSERRGLGGPIRRVRAVADRSRVAEREER